MDACLGALAPQLSVIVSRMHKNASRACIADKIRESLPPDLSWRFASATPFWAIEQAAKSFDRPSHKGSASADTQPPWMGGDTDGRLLSA